LKKSKNLSKIWYSQPSLQKINDMMSADTIMHHLGVEVIEIGDDYISKLILAVVPTRTLP